MTIARDMAPAITDLARVQCMVAQGYDGAALVERIGAILAVLQDCERRVIAMEGGPVPRHWRRQVVPAGEAGVVSLDAFRDARRGQGAGDSVA